MRGPGRCLRRRDIDLLRGELLVDEAIKEVNAKESSRVPESKRLSPSLIVGKTKTHETRRLKLPEFIRPMLAEHLAGSLPGGHAPDAFIFTMPTGAAVRHNNFYKRTFQPTVRVALPHHADYANRRGLRFHDLRHTCAAWLIAAGIHPYEIRKQLGHKDIRTTLNTYGHLFPSSADAVAGALNVGYAEAAERGSNVVSLR